jgi:thiamine-phosphate pyrophosphorylase
MLVISNPTAISNEIKLIHSLFEEGLTLFHVRKPAYSLQEMTLLLTQIDAEFHPQLVLHSHHQLTEKFQINRIHFPEQKRNDITVQDYGHKDTHLSTSTHLMADFNALVPEFEYAFLSPVYPSISKPHYFPQAELLATVKQRTNINTKLVALGGISTENILNTLEKGFDTVALLGGIWKAENPIKNFKSCQKIVLSF